MNQEKEEEKKKILKQTTIEDDAPKQTLAEKLKEKKKKQKKKQIIKYSILGFVAFIAYAIYWLFKPFYTGPDYGICRTFIELTVSYPSSVKVKDFSYTRDGSMRLWYTHTDAFGDYRMEEFRCWFTYNEFGVVSQINDIKMGKIHMPAQRVAALNSALHYFHANPVTYVWPYIPDSLEGVTFQTQAMRRIQFDPKK